MSIGIILVSLNFDLNFDFPNPCIKKETTTMRRFLSSLQIASLLLVATTGPAIAITILPTVNFTLRSSFNAGPVTAMDATWGNGGFDGFITNMEGSQVDRTYLEYDLSAITGPVASATFDFRLSGSSTDVISIDTYAADGVAHVSDWFTPLIAFTSFSPTGSGFSSFSFDVTSLINSNIGLPFGGVVFSIDAHPSQGFFDTLSFPSLNFTPIPEPSTLALFGIGALGMFGYLRKRRKA